MFLYPYDVLRLKNSLNKTSTKFIETYTDLVMRKGNYFPDVLLRMNNKNQMVCPFLSTKGCSVYLDRPYSCRMFPIEQAAIHSSTSRSIEIISSLRPPKFCMGQHETTEWTTDTWSENQHVKKYNTMTVQWSNVKKLFSVNPWDQSDSNKTKAKMAFMAAYNTNDFHEFIFGSSFLKRYKIKNKTLKKIKHDEMELLKLGFHWIKLFVWGIRSDILKLRSR